jgi:hypothetical protein
MAANAIMLSSSEVSQEFTFFKILPPEMQLKIWHEELLKGRVVEIEWDGKLETWVALKESRAFPPMMVSNISLLRLSFESSHLPDLMLTMIRLELFLLASNGCI